MTDGQWMVGCQVMAKPQVAFGLTWVSNQKYKNTNNN
jgi:hypothetical protein